MTHPPAPAFAAPLRALRGGPRSPQSGILLTLTVVAGGCATMGCALSEHHTLHSAPHLRREFHEIRPVAKGSGLEKSTGSCGAPLLHWVCFK